MTLSIHNTTNQQLITSIQQNGRMFDVIMRGHADFEIPAGAKLSPQARSLITAGLLRLDGIPQLPGGDSGDTLIIPSGYSGTLDIPEGARSVRILVTECSVFQTIRDGVDHNGSIVLGGTPIPGLPIYSLMVVRTVNSSIYYLNNDSANPSGHLGGVDLQVNPNNTLKIDAMNIPDGAGDLVLQVFWQ